MLSNTKNIMFNHTISFNSEIIFNRIGSNWFIDSFYLFILTPLSLIGVILNIINVLVLTKIIKNDKNFIKLFILLRIYCFNSILVNMIGIFLFLHAPRYIGIWTNHLIRVYRCIISNYFFSSLYFFGNVLEIIILHDRLTIFIPKIEICHKIRPSIKCLLAFFLCVLIDLPTFFRFTIKNDDELFAFENLTSPNLSSFYCKKWHDGIAAVITMIIRDMITLIIEMNQTILSSFHYRKFKTNKKHSKISLILLFYIFQTKNLIKHFTLFFNQNYYKSSIIKIKFRFYLFNKIKNKYYINK